MFRAPLLLAVIALAAPAAHAGPKDDVLLRALNRELDRSYQGLRKAEPVPLYFLGFEARDTVEYSVGAELGAVRYEQDRHYRSVDVDVRVGSRKLDNTHQMKGVEGFYDQGGGGFTEIPIDDDPEALRDAVWLRVDRAYKDALARYTKVETNKKVTAKEEDPSPDFSSEKLGRYYGPVELPAIDRAALRARVARLADALRPYAHIVQSQVHFNAERHNRYVVNTDGAQVVTGEVYLRLGFSMSARTEDGMDLSRYKAYDADDPAELPDDAAVLADLATAAGELQALLEGPLVKPYSGPAIFRNRATAVFFHEILGHRLEGHRQKLEEEGQTFKKMIGKKVTADFISVYDDATLHDHDGVFLRGFYKYDSEGVKARRVTLVENGVLKGFLLSRSPIEGFPASNGHGRRAAGNQVVARMGTTVVKAAETVPYARLRTMLIEEIRRQNKPYGLIFDDISGGFTNTSQYGPQSFKVIPHLVYRVYPDGRPDEVVRGVDIVGTPLASFNKIIAAADDYDVFNGSCGAESGWVPVAGVAPSLLVSEIEVEKKTKLSEQPPILPPPHHDPEARK